MLLSADDRMRISRFVLACCAAVLVAGCGTPPVDAEQQQAQDRAEMTASLAQSAAAWNRADLKGHLALYDPSVTMMTKTGPRPGVAPIEAAFGERYFKDGKPKQALRMESASIRMLSPTSALMTGRFVLSGGELPEQSGWFTLLWVKTAQGWRVVHDHTG